MKERIGSRLFGVRCAARPSAGVVRISVSEIVGIEVLPPMLSELRIRYPRLYFELELTNGSANVLEQEVDIAVRMHPPRQDALIVRKAASIPAGLFANVKYLSARGVPQTIADLDRHDLIGSDRSPADLALTKTLFPGIGRSRFVIRTDSHPAQLAAARAGLGIAAIQRPLGLSDPFLEAVLPEIWIASLETWIVTHENLRSVPRVRAVFDHLAERFQAYCRL